MTIRSGLICGAFALCAATTPSPSFALDPDQLLGSWRIVSYQRQDTESGERSWPLGHHPSGYLIVRPHHCALMLAPGGTELAGPPTAAPAATMVGYSGTYETEFDPQDPNGIMLTLDVEVAADPALIGTKRARYIWQSGNRLVIKSQPGPQASTMVFARAK
jgi:hypothetical protein